MAAGEEKARDSEEQGWVSDPSTPSVYKTCDRRQGAFFRFGLRSTNLAKGVVKGKPTFAGTTTVLVCYARQWCKAGRFDLTEVRLSESQQDITLSLFPREETWLVLLGTRLTIKLKAGKRGWRLQ